MEREAFRAWIDEKLDRKNEKHRRDIESRVVRVEKAFADVENNFTLAKEYKKDGGKSFLDKFCLGGKALVGTGVKLPINTNQMAPLKSAVAWYFRFLEDRNK